MNITSGSLFALRAAGPGSAGWPVADRSADIAGVGAGVAGPIEGAVSAEIAGRQAAVWFNAPVVDGSLVLRAPVQPSAGDPAALCQRFLDSFQAAEPT